MKLRVCGSWLLLWAALFATGRALAADPKIEELKQPPAGLSPDVAAAINPTGHRITDNGKPVCDVWLAREAPLKPRFKSSLRIKYPLQVGQLVGVIHFADGSKPTDFRGQPIKPGTYTLRYGLQPDDGNHLGTSEIRDFLVGSPPKADISPKRIEDPKDLFKLSAQASGSTHPAIFLLIPPPDKPFDAPGAARDAERNLLIFHANLNGKDGEKTVPVPISIVTAGKTEA